MEIEMSKPVAILGFESKREISRGSSMTLPTCGISLQMFGVAAS